MPWEGVCKAEPLYDKLLLFQECPYDPGRLADPSIKLSLMSIVV